MWRYLPRAVPLTWLRLRAVLGSASTWLRLRAVLGSASTRLAPAGRAVQRAFSFAPGRWRPSRLAAGLTAAVILTAAATTSALVGGGKPAPPVRADVAATAAAGPSAPARAVSGTPHGGPGRLRPAAQRGVARHTGASAGATVRAHGHTGPARAQRGHTQRPGKVASTTAHRATAHPASTHRATAHPASTHRATAHPASTHRATAHPASTHRASTHRATAHRASTHRASTHRVMRHSVWHPVLGIDSMFAVPASSLSHSGIHFEARYIEPGNPKSLTRGELSAMQQRGARLVAVWERGAADMLGGYGSGRWAASQAERGLRQLGIPNATVYFCADFDAAPSQQAAINSYLRGASSVIGWRRTGLYGDYWVLSRAFNAHVIRFGWQTFAWSGGRWDPRAALRQYRVNQSHAGVPVDLNLAVHRDYGAVYPARRG